ncbi:hypothetical protein F8O04_13235 [Pseudoclavibacter endophyticus]|uniref:Uncharacterized protein n=1 Tax=Pseudoclavibacter endophyticus TaxID=1778590 RepID=A0A6H9WA67_9MICO|nr:hypothetical protein F8O04_13235 [Pseudoclavibacter endophyticus]
MRTNRQRSDRIRRLPFETGIVLLRSPTTDRPVLHPWPEHPDGRFDEHRPPSNSQTPTKSRQYVRLVNQSQV